MLKILAQPTIKKIDEKADGRTSSFRRESQASIGPSCPLDDIEPFYR